MDFSDSASEASFRQKARAWLAANAPAHTYVEAKGDTEADMLVAAKAWQLAKYKDGWACLAWPKDYGGQGLSSVESSIFAAEEANWNVTSSPFGIISCTTHRQHGLCINAL